MEGVWSARDTSPSDIEAALRELLRKRHEEEAAYVPARVLNLVVVVDREWKGEIENRLDNVGRYHPSRTILCAVEEGRTSIDANASITDDSERTGMTLGWERVEVDVGPQHVKALDSIVDPLVVTDLATVVWAPHRHYEAVDSLLKLSQVVLLDSVDEPEPELAVRRAAGFERQAYVVDLAWLRSTPWRERVAAIFDPPRFREAVNRITAVTVRHHPSSVVAASLLVGWLATRLGWEPGRLARHGDTLHGRAKARRQEVEIHLETVSEMSVPGLEGITIGMDSGASFSFDRGPGGLTATRRGRDGKEQQFTALGASRGESGILGEGIRQALLRDPTYGPALEAAEKMLT
ncbi:MAG: glucose-6-phosphate dehydrogenase assembly protein OpcA [Thermoleophilaceae bacterium]|nr:glucose-6-phosphate dehydrogenase assembly protein OpcA [Thermoleophilaceae bacterium]